MTKLLWSALAGFLICHPLLAVAGTICNDAGGSAFVNAKENCATGLNNAIRQPAGSKYLSGQRKTQLKRPQPSLFVADSLQAPYSPKAAEWDGWPLLKNVTFISDLPSANKLSLPVNNSHVHKTPATSLLAACWSAAELKGTETDKLIRRTAWDRTPPIKDTPLTALAELKTDFGKSIRSVALAPDQKFIALTFDLCERGNEKAGYDAQIINFLREHQVKATLFAGGKWMRSHPEKTKQLMADPLFELGNHTWSHGNLRLVHGEPMRQQIRWTQVQYEILRDDLLNSACALPFKNRFAIPKLPATFRFPYGTCDQEALDAVSRYGLKPVQWNIVTGDPAKNQSAAAIIRAVLSQVKPGAIIVAHANGRGWNTATALPKMLAELQNRGFQLVTVSELLAMGKPVAVDSCYEVKPNDNLRYDKLFGK